MIVICSCGRDQYDDAQYSSCYQCYLNRSAEYERCIFCARWHSPRYNTCYRCRTVDHREEAGAALKMLILMRDDFACQRPGCGSRDQPQIDHILPCYEGGTADVWNLQVLCHACNKAKGNTWFYGSSYWERRVSLMWHYLTFWWDWLDDEERQRLVDDAAGHNYEHKLGNSVRFRMWRGEPIGNWPDEQDSHAVAAALGIDHDTLEPIGAEGA